MDYSVVVPLKITHLNYAVNLLKEMRLWDPSPSEVMVAASEVPKGRENEVGFRLREALPRSLPLTLSFTSNAATAGQNRNRGWALVTSTWTAMVDADDVYRPERMQLIAVTADSLSLDVVVHGYSYMQRPARFLRGAPERCGNRDVSYEELLRLNSNPLGTLEPHIVGRAGEGNLKLPGYGPPAIHHGHATIRTNLRELLTYSDLPYAEDSLLLRTMMAQGVRVGVSAWRLSLYDPWRWRQRPGALARQLKRRWN